MLVSFDMSDVIRKCEAAPRAIERNASEMLDEAGEEVLTSLRGGEHWTVRSGKTGGSFRMLSTGPWSRSVQSADKVALFLQAGTKPHQIWPKAGHAFKGPVRAGQSRRSRTDIGTHRVALRWYVGGRAVFASHVKHPGTRARYFVEIESARLNLSILPRLGAPMLATSMRDCGFAP